MTQNMHGRSPAVGISVRNQLYKARTAIVLTGDTERQVLIPQDSKLICQILGERQMKKVCLPSSFSGDTDVPTAGHL